MTEKSHGDVPSPMRILLSLVGRKGNEIDKESRAAVLSLLAHSNPAVRLNALEAAERFEIGADEARVLEELMAQKEKDLRREAIRQLLRQEDASSIASVERLLHSSNQPQRLGGLELLRRMIDAGRSVDQCRAVAAPWKLRQDSLSPEERGALEPFQT